MFVIPILSQAVPCAYRLHSRNGIGALLLAGLGVAWEDTREWEEVESALVPVTHRQHRVDGCPTRRSAPDVPTVAFYDPQDSRGTSESLHWAVENAQAALLAVVFLSFLFCKAPTFRATYPTYPYIDYAATELWNSIELQSCCVLLCLLYNRGHNVTPAGRWPAPPVVALKLELSIYISSNDLQSRVQIPPRQPMFTEYGSGAPDWQTQLSAIRSGPDDGSFAMDVYLRRPSTAL
ncbi:hypothetical protein DFH07DRAFT_943074 [Mycena maculata]|uniref:Uncharacterized protein n=1 Tax=Mycena maculata TaxID=230809 RepID=A0AAD7IK30_9AGAR|nr:hypothetical protein DFH07DRAFT_943074 [Mycena maculata]